MDAQEATPVSLPELTHQVSARGVGGIAGFLIFQKDRPLKHDAKKSPSAYMAGPAGPLRSDQRSSPCTVFWFACNNRSH